MSLELVENPIIPQYTSLRFSKSVVEIIRKRYSCRTYQSDPLDENIHQALSDYAVSAKKGPLGNQTRFELIAASEDDPKALKSLGTYGFIKDAPGFIVGAVEEGKYNLEDFGYQLELVILHATNLGLGTCWLGGTFTKSSFAKKISAREGELVPGVASVGYAAKKPRWIETFLRRDHATDRRLAWEELFFEGKFGKPLAREGLRGYSMALEMVRLGPSASNRQPWRIVKDDRCWHFYLQRTPGYRESPLVRFTTVADLQRIDMGIAMCHFESTVRELGLGGEWKILEPQIEVPDEFTEYTMSWVI